MSTPHTPRPTKFIPNADLDFKTMAVRFSGAIAKEPARFAVGDDDARALSQAVEQYASAFQACSGNFRSRADTMAKDAARAEAERIIRRLANTIKANDRVDAAARSALGLRDRAARSKKVADVSGLVMPAGGEPPRLWFVRALHQGNGAVPMHELKFRSWDKTKAKAPGAVRLELFVDLVPPDAPVPSHPGQNLNSRPWYLRSYSRSPIVLVPPMTSVPMRVVYWGRWADSAGNVGPFSKTVTAWIEGGSNHTLLVHPATYAGPRPMMVPLLEDGAGSQKSEHQVQCRLTVLEAQYQSYVSPQLPPALAAPTAEELPIIEQVPAPHLLNAA